MGQSQMDSPQNLATMGTQDENTTQYVFDTTTSLHVITEKENWERNHHSSVCYNFQGIS